MLVHNEQMQHKESLPIYDNGEPPPLPAKTGAAKLSTSSDNFPDPPPLPARPKIISPQTNCSRTVKPSDHRDPLEYPPLPSRLPPELPPKNSIRIPLDEETERQRTNVVRELIENEKLFHQQMSYVSEILSSGHIAVPITAEDLAAIKINLDDYISSSGEIIEAYKKAVSEAAGYKLSHACVAMHLMPILPRLCQVMINYIKEFDPQILEHRPQLKNYFAKADELLQKKEGMMTTLLDALFKLFQRPFHIMCILSRLKKFTPENHPDYQFVIAANTAIQTACDEADACKKKDAEYISTSNYQGSLEQDANGSLEDTRMMYYRKKQRKLVHLLENLSKWIETHSKDLKSLIGDRRCLIKASHGLLVSLDSVKGVSSVLDFHSTMVSHGIENFNSEKFDKSTNFILNRLNLVSVPLKKLKSPMNKLKSRAKDFERTKKAKPNLISAINKYRADESRAMSISEGILNRTEAVIRDLFLIYLYNVHKLMLFLAINPSGVMHRYAQNCDWIDRSEVDRRIEQDMEAWRMQIRRVQPLLLTAMDRLCGTPINNVVERSRKVSKKLNPGHATKKKNDVSEAIERAIFANAPSDPAMSHYKLPNPVGRAKVTFSYSDKQTTVHLRPGDTVNVIKWGDDLGNPEWALIRVGNSSDFYYPSNRLQSI
nr:hypothetical transcript [Hymenolepis microstoma]